MKIFRSKSDSITAYELAPLVMKHSLQEGDRFGISWKRGKRRKLRSYHLGSFEIPRWDDIDYTDPYFDIYFRGKKITLDFVIGTPALTFS